MRLSFAVPFALSCLAVAASARAADDHILTGTEHGTYLRIGQDLSRIVAAPLGLAFGVETSNGSAENVRRLGDEPGARLALVQADVYDAFLHQAAAGNAQAARLVKPLRVVLPLYDEDVYFVVRADSPLHFVHEIRGHRIDIGPVGSGTALTALNAYARMFGHDLPAADAAHLSNEDALRHLVGDRSIDVAVFVAGQPMPLFTQMSPEARKQLRLLRLAPAAPESAALTSAYAPGTIRAASYPGWLGADVSTISVKSLLVTREGQPAKARDELVKFARALCIAEGPLREQGHLEWREVAFDQPALAAHWSYYEPTHRVLSDCAQVREDDARASALALHDEPSIAAGVPAVAAAR